MAMNFPTAPTEGQVYTGPGGPTYVFTGGVWVMSGSDDGGGSGGASIEVGDTPPASPQPNALWWESDTGHLFLYFDDGNTQQFVQVNGSGSGPSTGNNSAVRLNPQQITENATIAAGMNGMSAGPITIANGVTVDVASGSTWTVV
jgi:hypothetical protein